MTKIDKNVWVAIVIVLILILILFIGFSKGKADKLVSDLVGTGSEEVGDTSVAKKSSSKTLTYNEALALYEGRRVQLGTNCQATPSEMSLKNNTKIMIDNRSALVRGVEVGDKQMTIQPWGFKEVTLSSGTLPITWYVDCGDSKNVASLLIQL